MPCSGVGYLLLNCDYVKMGSPNSNSQTNATVRKWFDLKSQVIKKRLSCDRSVWHYSPFCIGQRNAIDCCSSEPERNQLFGIYHQRCLFNRKLYLKSGVIPRIRASRWVDSTSETVLTIWRILEAWNTTGVNLTRGNFFSSWGFHDCTMIRKVIGRR